MAIYIMKVLSKSLNIILVSLVLFSACTSKNDSTILALSDEIQMTSNLVTLSAAEIAALDLKTGKLEEKNLNNQLKISGSLQNLAQSKAFVSTQMQGLVHSIPVQLGQSVSQGQVIAYISSKAFIDLQENYLRLRSIAQIGAADTMALLFNEQYIALQENYKSLQPQLQYAAAEVERQNTLLEGKAGSLKQLQAAQTAWEILKEKEKTLKAQMQLIAKHSQENIQIQEKSLANQLSILGIDVKNLKADNMQRLLPLHAPISGKVSHLKVRIGEAIDMQAPVAEIISNKDLYVTLNAYEHQLPFFKQGEKIQFFVSPYENELYEAQITQIGVAFDAQDKSTLIQAKITAPNERLMEGLPIMAIIQNTAQKYWTIPKDALAHTEGKDYIFVVQGKNTETITFEQIYVEKLITTATEIGIRIPQLAQIQDKEIAINQAFFVLGKMTNTGEE